MTKKFWGPGEQVSLGEHGVPALPSERSLQGGRGACAPPGKSLLDLLIGRDRAKQLIPLDDAEIKRELLGAARRKAPPGAALPGDDEGLFYRVYRWEEALCMGTPGMLAEMANVPGQLAGSIDNLFLAGDYMGVPSVNGALSSGERAAHEVADLLASRAG